MTLSGCNLSPRSRIGNARSHCSGSLGWNIAATPMTTSRIGIECLRLRKAARPSRASAFHSEGAAVSNAFKSANARNACAGANFRLGWSDCSKRRDELSCISFPEVRRNCDAAVEEVPVVAILESGWRGTCLDRAAQHRSHRRCGLLSQIDKLPRFPDNRSCPRDAPPIRFFQIKDGGRLAATFVRAKSRWY